DLDRRGVLAQWRRLIHVHADLLAGATSITSGTNQEVTSRRVVDQRVRSVQLAMNPLPILLGYFPGAHLTPVAGLGGVVPEQPPAGRVHQPQGPHVAGVSNPRSPRPAQQSTPLVLPRLSPRCAPLSRPQLSPLWPSQEIPLLSLPTVSVSSMARRTTTHLVQSSATSCGTSGRT